ncbi:cupin domain-containing protein [Maricaulis sp.]|uniref:cupin domain-containing protein n=1 Tax=Maricaulis sp. TaxID=1486257 RepID=UPI000C3D7942|nr:cupin domain-containing protein [Maricaulis sp.]MAC90174.1 auxin-binding protein [Maricaulis sp.]
MVRNPVTHIDDAPLENLAHGETFSADLARLGPLIGLQQLGCCLTVVPPGKTAFPYHNHHAIEEAIIILEGEGAYRFGEDCHAVRAGHVLAAPTGGRDVAHQLLNTGDADLKYICVSTQQPVDVVEYPDSNKVGAVHWSPTDDDAIFRHRAFAAEPVDYWEGED